MLRAIQTRAVVAARLRSAGAISSRIEERVS
jgi:hypothetical protein